VSGCSWGSGCAALRLKSKAIFRKLENAELSGSRHQSRSTGDEHEDGPRILEKEFGFCGENR
jgi:hypothetical protein